MARGRLLATVTARKSARQTMTRFSILNKMTVSNWGRDASKDVIYLMNEFLVNKARGDDCVLTWSPASTKTKERN